MNAKLIKNHYGYTYFLADENGDGIATSDNGKLSKQNCDEIFEVVDVEKLAEEELLKAEKHHKLLSPITYKDGVKKGFNKAMELNKDKVFTLDDVSTILVDLLNDISNWKYRGTSTDIINQVLEKIQQPTEIDVTFNPEERDSEGCLILKRVV